MKTKNESLASFNLEKYLIDNYASVNQENVKKVIENVFNNEVFKEYLQEAIDFEIWVNTP